MYILSLPFDCVNEISSNLDIISYINWKNSTVFLKDIISIKELKGIYNGTWKYRNTICHYFGSVINKKCNLTNYNGLIREGFGIYTKKLSKNSILKFIGYWKNNELHPYKKIIDFNPISNTEKWIVKKNYDNDFEDFNQKEFKYYGEWFNKSRNGNGSLYLYSKYKQTKLIGIWLNNIKNGCFNEIYYNMEQDDFELWNKYLENIYIRYYKNNKKLPFEIDINRYNVILKTEKRTIIFNLKNQFVAYTACHYINKLITNYNDNYFYKPICVISNILSGNKCCNCELCNHIIKHKKEYLEFINI